MKTGVSTLPWDVSSRPRRAAPSLARSSKRIAMIGGVGAPSRGGTVLVVAQLQAVLSQLFADLGERGLAEVLRFQQLVRRALNQFAERVDAQTVHAFPGPHR